jgi:hypothetical protein
VVHVIRPTARDGATAVTSGFSRVPPVVGGQRIELRADVDAYGPQIGMTLSILGRIWWVRQQGGDAPWRPLDLVTTAERPVFGVSHFLLSAGGSVRVGGEAVEILCPWPISVAERNQLSSSGEERAAWLAARGNPMERWAPLLDRKRPFDT